MVSVFCRFSIAYLEHIMQERLRVLYIEEGDDLFQIRHDDAAYPARHQNPVEFPNERCELIQEKMLENMRTKHSLARFGGKRQSLCQVHIPQPAKDAPPMLIISLRIEKPGGAHSMRKKRNTRDEEMRRDVGIDPAVDATIEST